MVGPGRFELPTSPLSGVRSNQLSYGPDLVIPARPRSSYLSRKERETWAAMPALTPILATRRFRGQGAGLRDGDLTDPILF